MIRGEIPIEIRDTWFARKTILVVLLIISLEMYSTGFILDSEALPEDFLRAGRWPWEGVGECM